jgi:hypothetical protein
MRSNFTHVHITLISISISIHNSSLSQVLAGMWAAARDERTRAEAEAAILYRNKTAVSEVRSFVWFICGQAI